MKKYLVTVRRKSTHYFEVDAKNKSRAVEIVNNRVIGTSMDCNENYGEGVAQKWDHDPAEKLRTYVTGITPVSETNRKGNK